MKNDEMGLKGQDKNNDEMEFKGKNETCTVFICGIHVIPKIYMYIFNWIKSSILESSLNPLKY